jgi:hypothetical protein
MIRRILLLVVAVAALGGAYFLGRSARPADEAGGVPKVAASVDYIRQMGDLVVLRASVKEIVTSRVGMESLIRTPGKLAIICHFDIKYSYDLRKARIAAGSRDDGTRYCVITLPKHQYDISTKDITFYDEQDGTWLGLPQRTPPDARTKALDAARAQAEAQAKTFLGAMEGEIQASARATLGQIARAFGFADVTLEFDK